GEDRGERRSAVRLQPPQRGEAIVVPPMGVIAGNSVDHGLGVRRGAPDGLIGVPKPTQILEHEYEVVCRFFERGEVRTRGAQRVGETDLLVETDLTEVEVGGFAEVRTGRWCRASGASRSPRRVRPARPRGEPETTGRAARRRRRSARVRMTERLRGERR